MPLVHCFRPDANNSYGGGAAQRLAEQRANHPNPEARDRCAAILYFLDGNILGWVAEQGLSKPYDPERVLKWVNLWNAGEVDPLPARL